MTARKRQGPPPIPASLPTPTGRSIPVKMLPRGEIPAKDQHIAGLYDSRQFVIYIASDLAPDVQWQVLLHEWGHMVCDLGGLTFRGEKEEAVVTVFATAIMQLLIADGHPLTFIK